MANQIMKSKLISAIITFSFIPLALMVNFLPNSNSRSLQYVEYSTNGVYYQLTYLKNSITGTGDRLQDVPYKALCVIKNCDSNCCSGDINNMQCASIDDCKMFFDSTRKGNVAAAVIIPIAVTAIFLVTFLVLTLKYKVNIWIAALIGFICMFVITIPFVIYYLMKNKPFGICDKASKNEIVKSDSLDSNKNIELKNEADKIILCDNKKNSDLSNNNKAHSSSKDYKKLNIDEESNRNADIISISNKQENGGQKRSNMPDIVFDENLKDEIINKTASNKEENSYNRQKSNNSNNENNQINNSIGNGDDDNKDLLEKSHNSEAKRSENNVSGYNRQESNANRSVKSATKSQVNNEEETPQGAEENNNAENANEEQNNSPEQLREDNAAENNENAGDEVKEEAIGAAENVEPEVIPDAAAADDN